MAENKNRAAIYARFSSHNQRNESIEIQVEKSTEYCTAHGLEVVKIYADYAQTGRNVDRDGFQRMMEDSRKGMFDYVVIYKVTRIMRNRDEMALARIMLRRAGVEILYAGENLGEGSTRVLNLGILEVLAEWESAIDSERIRDGIQKNAARCMASGQTHYGWDVVNGYYQINEHEAAVMRRMRDMLLSGRTMAQITQTLNAAGERTRRGNEFRPGTVSKLLHREQNCGVYQYAGVRVENGMPAIWPRETQDLITSVLKMRHRSRRRIDKEAEYPLSGKMVCEKCGRSFVGVSGTSKSGRVYNYYTCKSCRRSFRREEVEELVCDSVLESIAQPETRERIAAVMAEHNNNTETRDEKTSEMARIRKEIKAINTKFERIWAAIEAGITPPGGKERVDELTARKTALEAELKAWEEKEDTALTWDDIATWLDSLTQNPDPAYIINGFVRLIVVSGDDLRLYFTFDPWPDDELDPRYGTKKRRTHVRKREFV